MNYIEIDPIWVALDLEPSLCDDRNSESIQMSMVMYYPEYDVHA